MFFLCNHGLTENTLLFALHNGLSNQEDVAIAAGIPEFLKRSILLQTFGVQGRHACQEVDHVVIPPHVPPEVARELPEPEKAHRDIFAFFRGKMEVHPKNISGHFYSR